MKNLIAQNTSTTVPDPTSAGTVAPAPSPSLFQLVIGCKDETRELIGRIPQQAKTKQLDNMFTEIITQQTQCLGYVKNLEDITSSNSETGISLIQALVKTKERLQVENSIIANLQKQSSTHAANEDTNLGSMSFAISLVRQREDGAWNNVKEKLEAHNSLTLKDGSFTPPAVHPTLFGIPFYLVLVVVVILMAFNRFRKDNQLKLKGIVPPSDKDKKPSEIKPAIAIPETIKKSLPKLGTWLEDSPNEDTNLDASDKVVGGEPDTTPILSPEEDKTKK